MESWLLRESVQPLSLVCGLRVAAVVWLLCGHTELDLCKTVEDSQCGLTATHLEQHIAVNERRISLSPMSLTLRVC